MRVPGHFAVFDWVLDTVRGLAPSRRRSSLGCFHRDRRFQSCRALFAEALESRLYLSGIPVLEWNFSQTASNQATVNGAGINTGGDFFPTNLKDDANTVGPGQSLSYLGVHGTYLVEAAIPNPPAVLPAGWDGGAVRFNGGNYARFADN